MIYHYAELEADGETIKTVHVIDDQHPHYDFGTGGKFTPFSVADCEGFGWACCGIEGQVHYGMKGGKVRRSDQPSAHPPSNGVTPVHWEISTPPDYEP